MIQQTTIVLTKYNDQALIPNILIIDQSKISPLTYFYFKNHLDQEKPYTTLNHAAKCVQMLYDYYLIHKSSLTPPKKKTFLEDFINAFIKKDTFPFKDTPRSQMERTPREIRRFSKWVKLHAYLVKNSIDEDFSKVIIESYDFLHRVGKSKLFFPKLNDYKFEKVAKTNVVKSFPINKVITLIESTPNIRDKILYILLAFGGRRMSECLNLFVEDFKLSDNLKVIIADPIVSKIEDKSRKEYLKNKFNLNPRPLMPDNLFVGWKGMRFEDSKNFQSEIIFIGMIEKYLISLHEEYLKWRKQFNHHPFYFCNKDGRPLTISSANNLFNKACQRIGLKLEKTSKNDGSNPYGLRNFYCYYCVKALELDDIIVQRLVGFTDVSFVEKFKVNKEEQFSKLNSLELK